MYQSIPTRSISAVTKRPLNLLLGIAHARGLGFEAKAGTLDSPDLKFGVGWTFRSRVASPQRNGYRVQLTAQMPLPVRTQQPMALGHDACQAHGSDRIAWRHVLGLAHRIGFSWCQV